MCEGCISKNDRTDYKSVIEKAKQYASKNNKTVGVYKEGENYFFIELEYAGQYPILEYISGS